MKKFAKFALCFLCCFVFGLSFMFIGCGDKKEPPSLPPENNQPVDPAPVDPTPETPETPDTPKEPEVEEGAKLVAEVIISWLDDNGLLKAKVVEPDLKVESDAVVLTLDETKFDMTRIEEFEVLYLDMGPEYDADYTVEPVIGDDKVEFKITKIN